MSNLFDFVENQAAQQMDDAPPPQPETPDVLSVSQLSTHLKNVVEGTFPHVSVEGEISGLKRPASGHIYFNLKENRDVLNAIVWRSTAEKLKTLPQESLQMVARGRLTTYGERSTYQLIVTSLQPAGVGALMQLFEERKAKLEEEGLFDTDRKKPLPPFPQKIGVITSPTGAVIQDILHRLADRWPTHVQLWPTRVQGEGAAAEISTALEGFNTLPTPPDVIILARGGGSLEDLWAFNEEDVVRAVANSAIPVVTGVGHEPDVTLVDYAADVRAPTPTAAAELITTPTRADLLADLHGQQRQLATLPKRLIDQEKQRLDDRTERLTLGLKNTLTRQKDKLDTLTRMLATLAPEAPLKRGYVMVTDDKGQTITSAQTKATAISITFHDGKRGAKLEKI